MKRRWNEQMEKTLIKMAYDGKNNQEIADVLGLEVQYVRAKRSEFGITMRDFERERIEKEDCFANEGETCYCLEKKRCNGCAFYKKSTKEIKEETNV